MTLRVRLRLLTQVYKVLKIQALPISFQPHWAFFISKDTPGRLPLAVLHRSDTPNSSFLL
jgi:hypothetical protein